MTEQRSFDGNVWRQTKTAETPFFVKFQKHFKNASRQEICVMKTKEGYMEYLGYRTWYRIAGECTEGTFPLLVLHGGPGSCHNYLTSLDELAEHGRQVIYYDQLGCGHSQVPEGVISWNEQIFLRELQRIREHLELDELHILGQSWGGMLGMQYLESRPEGVKSLIVSSSPASMKRWKEEAGEWLALLPEEDRQAVLDSEQSGDYRTPAYKKADREYTRRHVCSLQEPWPEPVAYSLNSHTEAYEQMIGPSEFTITGNLKDWDITADLDKIAVPVLITSGTMDEASPLMMKELCEKIPGSRWELLRGTHLVHWEQKKRFNRLVLEFMEETERREAL